MKFAIIGQGAIASLFTFYFQALNPIILARAKPNASLLPKTVIDMTHKRHQLEATLIDINSANSQAFDAIIICVKHYQLFSLLPTLAKWLHNNTVLVLIQNGMGGSDLLRQHYTKHPVIVGTTTDAIYALDDTHYQITAQGRLSLGLTSNDNAQKPIAQNILALLSKHHPHAHIFDNIDDVLFEKLAINAVINPLTAVLGIKNGELLQYPDKIKGLEKEVFSIYEAMGLVFEPSELSAKIKDVITLTANNYSSMYQDIHLNRQTEIDGVLGYLIQQANSKQVDIPHILSYYQKIKQLEH